MIIYPLSSLLRISILFLVNYLLLIRSKTNFMTKVKPKLYLGIESYPIIDFLSVGTNLNSNCQIWIAFLNYQLCNLIISVEPLDLSTDTAKKFKITCKLCRMKCQFYHFIRLSTCCLQVFTPLVLAICKFSHPLNLIWLFISTFIYNQ